MGMDYNFRFLLTLVFVIGLIGLLAVLIRRFGGGGPQFFSSGKGRGRCRIAVATSSNSLWRPGARAFFKNLRAREVGDTVQVILDIDDKAEIDNATVRSRTNSKDAQTPALFGFENSLDQICPMPSIQRICWN
jgi:hypothetical protein